jgi:hypothetical protein
VHENRPAVQISIHAAGQKRSSIVADRRLIQRKAAVRPIARIVTQSANRHQAMKSFESIDDRTKVRGVLFVLIVRTVAARLSVTSAAVRSNEGKFVVFIV